MLPAAEYGADTSDAHIEAESVAVAQRQLLGGMLGDGVECCRARRRLILIEARAPRLSACP